MEKYNIKCNINNDVTRKVIECRTMTIENGSYCFWVGEIGVTNKLKCAFPVMFTIVESI